MVDVVVGLGEIGRAVGWYFGAAFVAIVAIWVQFMVRWGDEKRELGLSNAGLARLLAELERPRGTLHRALANRHQGEPCEYFADQQQFKVWFEKVRGAGSQSAGLLFHGYLWDVLSSRRTRLRASDNRVNLTGVRNKLKRYRYHRWLNFGLANTAVSLGILGTVTGLWSGFNQIDFGGGDIAGVMDEVMGSLSRALYTTGVGVLISIPIVITGLRMEQQLEEMFGMICEVQNAVVATLRQLENDGSGDGD